MKNVKKFITLFAAIALLSSTTQPLEAAGTCYTGGCAYKEVCACPSLTPAIALGAIAIVAIVAVAVQNSHNEHGHCH